MLMQLVKKDFIYLVVSLRIVVLFMILFALFLPMSNIGFACVMPALICYVGVYSTLAYEERNKTILLNATLPVSRRDICLAKYIQAVLIILITAILSLMGVFMGVSTQVYSSDLVSNGGLVSMILLMLGSGMIYSGLILPVIFRFGTVKARYILMLTYMVLFIGGSNDYIIQGLEKIIKLGNETVSMIGFIVVVILFAISYLSSLRIWETKEF